MSREHKKHVLSNTDSTNSESNVPVETTSNIEQTAKENYDAVSYKLDSDVEVPYPTYARSSRRASPSPSESVDGEDNTVLVVDTGKKPWFAICALEIQGTKNNTNGTGWFVGSKTIVTAAHCVFSEEDLGDTEKIIIYPGRRDSFLPYPEIESTKFDVPNAWKIRADPAFDYAVIHLDQAVGDTTGVFKMNVGDDTSLSGMNIVIAGYPKDVTAKDLLKDSGTKQFRGSGMIRELELTRILHNVDTFEGQSGSPVIIGTSLAEKEPQVVGIHSYGIRGSDRFNSATRITREVYDWIMARMI